jgi:hypothetical protein
LQFLHPQFPQAVWQKLQTTPDPEPYSYWPRR